MQLWTNDHQRRIPPCYTILETRMTKGPLVP